MSDYFTIDLQTVFNKEEQPKSTDEKTPDNSTEGKQDPASETEPKKTKSTKKKAAQSSKIDWAKKLEQLIADNEALDPEVRESESTVENNFWDEYFADPMWDPDIAKIAKQIKLFKEDIKTLGFDPKKNALLCFFLKNKLAKNNIIKPGYINSNNYVVLHNAVSKPRMLADSELMIGNRYNIIYCRDLYTKHAKDMEKYLALQKNILIPNASFYSEETQKRNISTFLEVGQKDVTKPNAKLNKLSELNTRLGKNSGSDETGSGGSSGNNASSGNKKFGRQEILQIINNLTSASHCQAALQYLSMMAPSKRVNSYVMQALTTAPIRAEALAAATSDIAKAFNGESFTVDEAEEYAEKIFDKIRKF